MYFVKVSSQKWENFNQKWHCVVHKLYELPMYYTPTTDVLKYEWSMGYVIVYLWPNVLTQGNKPCDLQFYGL